MKIAATNRGKSKAAKPPARRATPPPRKRGHSQNGRGDAPQIVGGLAVTRDGFPVRLGVFPGNTVDVTTVAQVKEDLRGWQLTRCLFVGDAGMVSQANLQTLAQEGGKYLLAMPLSAECVTWRCQDRGRPRPSEAEYLERYVLVKRAVVV